MHVQLLNVMCLCVVSLHRANWVKVSGTKYQLPCALVVGQSDDEELIFGTVLGILVHCREVFFEFELMEGQYCKHYHAYALSFPHTSSQKAHRFTKFSPLRALPLSPYFIITIHCFEEQYLHVNTILHLSF